MRPRPPSEFTAASVFAAGLTLAARVAGVIGTYGFFVILGRVHGAGAFGQFVVATTAAQILATLARLGTDHGVMRVAGDRLAAGDEAGANAAIRLAIVIALGCGIVLVLLALPLLGIDQAYAIALRGPRLPIFFAIPVIAAVLVMSAALRARHEAAKASMSEGMVRPLTLFGGALVAMMWWPTERAFALAFFISWSVGVVVTAAFLPWRGRLDTGAAKPLFAAALPMLAVTLLQQNNAALDVLALAAAAPPEVVGHYGAAVKIVGVVLMINVAVTAVFAPHVPALAADREALGAFYRSTTRWILLATLPALIVTAALPELPLSFFGPEFVRTGALPLTILSVSTLVHVAVGPTVYLLVMAGRPIALLRPYLATLVVTFLALAALVPRWQAVGAAVGMATGTLFLRAILFRVARRELGVTAQDGRNLLLIGGAVVIAIAAKLLSGAFGLYVAAAVALLAFAALAVFLSHSRNRLR